MNNQLRPFWSYIDSDTKHGFAQADAANGENQRFSGNCPDLNSLQIRPDLVVILIFANIQAFRWVTPIRRGMKKLKLSAGNLFQSQHRR